MIVRFLKKSLALFISLAMLFSAVPLAGCGAEAAEIVEEYSVTAPTNLPAIHITLDNDVPLESVTKEEYVPGTVSVVGSDEYADILDAVASIKGRGNFSWEAPKKPYNLKFTEKTDLLGMGAAKKWVMTANYWDKTMLRNYITLTLAKEMGFEYAVDVAFVDLYINEQYMGNYLVSEKVEIGKERIKIDDDNGGVLLEIEQPYRHLDVCDYCHQVQSGVHFTYCEPEPDDRTPEQYAELMQTTNAILDEVDTALSQGYEVYSQYIDVDSFVDWYILNEFCKNYDSRFVTSCYVFYDPADGKIHMGPPWDYDTCYGNQNPHDYGYPEDFYVKNDAQWYRTLFEDSTFAGLVMERWTELKEAGVISNVINNALSGAALIRESAELTFEAWPTILPETGLRGDNPAYLYTTFDEEVDYLTKFIALRTYWLDEQWNTDYDSRANTIDTLNNMTKGLFIDNTMRVDNIYRAKMLMLYKDLDAAARAKLDPAVQRYYSEQGIAQTTAAIGAVTPITNLAQKGAVVDARTRFDALTLRDQLSVENFNDLLAAEAKIAELGGGSGGGQDLTALVDRSTLNAPEGYNNEGVANLFDGNVQTKYCVNNNAPTIMWQMTEAGAINSYTLTTANDTPERDPLSWVLEGSNNGRTWTKVDDVENGGLPEERFGSREFFCDSPAAYRFYRLVIRENGGEQNTQLAEITLGGGSSEAALDVADAITALGIVNDLSQKNQVEAARAAYDALSAEDAAEVGNYLLLIKAEIALAELSGDTAANAVDEMIAALPDAPTAADETAILTAYAAYEKLDDLQKLMVDDLDRLLDALQVVGESNVLQVAALFDGLGDTLTYADAPKVVAARAAFDALSADDQALVYNLDKLTRAEAQMKTIHDAFGVEVRMPEDLSLASVFNITPWMNVENLSEAELEQTLDALTAEIRHQYVKNGYCMGLVDGYYELDDHGGFAIVQSDMYVYGTTVDSDNVANPWGQQQRYWAGVIAPFSGMAFSVNGYFAQSFPYAMPLSDAFEYNGRTYQIYSNVTQSHTAPLLLRGTTASIMSEELYPGSGDDANNNTFAYAYAAYSQANKADGKVLGAPAGNVLLANGGRVKYQRFDSNDGMALIAGSAALIAQADANSGKPTGAYTITGELLDALYSLGKDASAAFAVTGAPIAEATANDGGLQQTFENGVLKVLADGSYRFTANASSDEDAAAAKAVSDLIDALPEWEDVTEETFDAFVSQVDKASDAFDALTITQQNLITDDRYMRLMAYVSIAAGGWPDDPIIPDPPIEFTPGDVDDSGVVDVADILKLKDLIMKEEWTPAQLLSGDLNESTTLDVGDIMAVKNIIMGVN